MDLASSSQLSVATPERVALSLPVAGIGHRCLAYLVDVLLLFLGWVAFFFVLTLATADPVGAFQGLSNVLRVVLVLAVFAAQWLYWTLCEQLFGGQTPGKRLLGIRVVRRDGSPVSFFESATRNLLRWVDFLPFAYAAGVFTMLLTTHHRRLGDLAAGTLLIREEQLDLSKYDAPGAVVTGPTGGGAGPLVAEDAELILQFLARAQSLEPQAQARLRGALVQRFLSHLAPDERERARVDGSFAEAALRRRVAKEG